VQSVHARDPHGQADRRAAAVAALGADAALDGSPELVPLGGVIEELRMVKDESEIELLAKACSITGEAFSAVLDWLRPGVTERAFAVALGSAGGWPPVRYAGS
jgi:Xaa-Pro aminopeptidase